MLTMLVGRRPRMQRCNANDPSMLPFGRSRLSWPALSTATPANDKLLKRRMSKVKFNIQQYMYEYNIMLA